MKTIFLIEDDQIMTECIARAITHQNPVVDLRVFSNAISAVQALDQDPPDLICLDIMLDGPDGFSFLNELISYDDTSRIPILIISSLNLAQQDLGHYNIQAIIQKETMTPTEISQRVEEILAYAE